LSAKDRFHEAVKNALLKEGWEITDDPLFVRVDESDLYVDLGAEKIIGAQKGKHKIAVEVKSFIGVSLMKDFHLAVGQFINYKVALRAEMSERQLFLAIPVDVYSSFFKRTLVQMVVEQQEIDLLVFEEEQEVIVSWSN
jgi:hypothetical protein